MLLAAGLFAAGVGTAAFLRTSLIDGVDAQVDALAGTDAASPLVDLQVEGGRLTAEPVDNAPSTDYFVAVFEPVEGELVAAAGGRGGPQPVFPPYYKLDLAQSRELAIVTLPAEHGETQFRATVTVQEFANTGTLYAQMVAVPLTTVNRTIANYIGIYSILAIVIVVGGAVLTRWLVTLTFRSLGEVESTADAISAGDFSQRMTDIEPTTTEVGRLKTAINAMLDHVDAAISQRDATVRQMRRFIGDASHELRTPLVTVRGYAELYRMGAVRGDEDIAQSMDRIEKEAIRMGLLVEDLLALARLDERRDVVLGPVDLRPVARDAAMDVRATAPLRPVTVIDTTVYEPATETARTDSSTESADSKRRSPNTSAIARAGATLSLLRRRPKPVPALEADGATPDAQSSVIPATDNQASSGGLEPIVLGDENRVRQVVANLLGNARRFTAEDSPIELRIGVDARARMGWIEIVDHGEGVPDQLKDKIFQRFWRADTSRTRETGGSGLGLSIVASIVEALHGTVDVADTPGSGATFRVALPLADARDASEHPDIPTQPLPRLADASE